MKLRISLIFCKLNVTGKWQDNDDDDDCLIVWPFGDSASASTLVGVTTITILAAILHRVHCCAKLRCTGEINASLPLLPALSQLCLLHVLPQLRTLQSRLAFTHFVTC